ncbi:hypothetical protein MKY85_20625 [Paenibacillus sp. FSL R5-0749]
MRVPKSLHRQLVERVLRKVFP